MLVLILHITCKKLRTILISDKELSENKTVRNFQAPKIFTVKIAPKRVSFMERTLVETLIQIRNGLIDFYDFPRRWCICKFLEGTVKLSFPQGCFSL